MLIARRKNSLRRFPLQTHYDDAPDDSGRVADQRRVDYLDAHLRSITIYALYLPVIEVLTAVALASLIVTGAGRLGADTVTIADEQAVAVADVVVRLDGPHRLPVLPGGVDQVDPAVRCSP